MVIRVFDNLLGMMQWQCFKIHCLFFGYLQQYIFHSPFRVSDNTVTVIEKRIEVRCVDFCIVFNWFYIDKTVKRV